MKFLVSQVAFFLRDRQAKRNLAALRTYLLFLAGVVLLYSVLFHVMMIYEGQEHSWLTGFYWTLTVMSTLGFGDITFDSDLGRFFSILVMVTGVILLLIMLPFAFIRYFYAPWLEAQIRARVPREVGSEVVDHVIVCQRDWITNGLIRKLDLMGIPYCVLEEDPEEAARMQEEGLSVIVGAIDDPKTYKAIHAERARLVFANAEDPVNTNILLTIRSISETVPILALAEEEDSLDIFMLSGATFTLPLKTRLGEHLAARVASGSGVAHEVGRYRDLVIVEFLIHDTELAGRTLMELKLRERTGITVVGVWKSGRLCPVDPREPMSGTAVPVAVGTVEQVGRLNRLLGKREPINHRVLVIGGGKVGRSTARALKRRGVDVCILDRNPDLREELQQDCDRVVIGNASDLGVMENAGIREVGAVALTTNDDAQNIHLTVYCRRLCPDLGIVSRITRERNIEAIYRAGADFVLSYASLGCEYVTANLCNREPVMVGEGADFFPVVVPSNLVGKTLGESRIGATTGLVVLAIEFEDRTVTNPGPDVVLDLGATLHLLGTTAQRDAFGNVFGVRQATVKA